MSAYGRLLLDKIKPIFVPQHHNLDGLTCSIELLADFNAEIQLILGVPLPKTISVPVDAHAPLLPLSDEPV